MQTAESISPYRWIVLLNYSLIQAIMQMLWIIEVRKSYGAQVDDTEVKKYYCSFCGTQADEGNGMLISTHANICHNCLRMHSDKLL